MRAVVQAGLELSSKGLVLEGGVIGGLVAEGIAKTVVISGDGMVSRPGTVEVLFNTRRGSSLYQMSVWRRFQLGDLLYFSREHVRELTVAILGITRTAEVYKTIDSIAES
jgi:hypothetical protein